MIFMSKYINIQFFAIAGQTTTNFPNAILDFYDRVALKKALPLITFRKWGQKRPLPGIRVKLFASKSGGLWHLPPLG